MNLRRGKSLVCFTSSVYDFRYIFIYLSFTIAISVKKEYKYSTSKKSLDDAQKSCKMWGGNLVTIESSEENDQVVKELKSRWV